MKSLGLIFILFALPEAIHAISCLVMKTGNGLISEDCPSSSVGCRIKIRSDHVIWYNRKLYDRNQLVCIYPGEYHGTAGCVRKPSGDVRCWCTGMSNCNDANTSQQLFNAFHKSDKQKMMAIIRRLENAGSAEHDDNDVTDHENDEEETTTTTTTTVAITTTTSTPPSTSTTHKKKEKTTTFAPDSTKLTTKMTKTTTIKTISNELESEEFSSPTVSEFGKEFEETRRKLLEEMREEDERLQQMLADEEAEMITDDADSVEDREEQIRKERERNRMERNERARVDERRRLTEEEQLRKHEKSQKQKEHLHSDEKSDEYDSGESIPTLHISIISSIITILFMALGY